MDPSGLLLHLGTALDQLVSPEIWQAVLFYIPFVLFFELPVYGLMLIGLMRHAYEERFQRERDLPAPRFPRVTCMAICYSEGPAITRTIRTLVEQIYPGFIEIIILIDGSEKNQTTHQAALEAARTFQGHPLRKLIVVPKQQRGGRVSSLNLGLSLARGEVIMALDGDTSFDNDMVAMAVRHFADPKVAAVSGVLRVRNAMKNLATRFQGLEYLISIHAGRTGLSAFNVVNNVSGAFGVFRTAFVRQVGGWDSGSAEDLDLTIRINSYFGRDRQLRIVFEPGAIGHTDAPDTWMGLWQQRLRWDGDLVYIYLRKHLKSFSPGMMGWSAFLFRTWTGLMFTVFTPLLIVLYTAYLLVSVPLWQTAVIMAFLWAFYAVVTLVIYLAFRALVSERPRYDLRYLPLTPFFGLYTLILRLVAACAVLWNIVGRSHLDSSMAPWWVLRKGKF